MVVAELVVLERKTFQSSGLSVLICSQNLFASLKSCFTQKKAPRVAAGVSVPRRRWGREPVPGRTVTCITGTVLMTCCLVRAVRSVDELLELFLRNRLGALPQALIGLSVPKAREELVVEEPELPLLVLHRLEKLGLLEQLPDHGPPLLSLLRERRCSR